MPDQAAITARLKIAQEEFVEGGSRESIGSGEHGRELGYLSGCLDESNIEPFQRVLRRRFRAIMAHPRFLFEALEPGAGRKAFGAPPASGSSTQ
jgi:hypothetical protein